KLLAVRYHTTSRLAHAWPSRWARRHIAIPGGMASMATMLEVFTKVAPRAYPNYVRAFQNDAALFTRFKINTPLRIAHFLAQTMYECGRGTILFENLRYRTVTRLLQIFGVGNHSAAVTPEEAPGLLNNPEKLGERVYGLGNPRKARELGNTRPGDG